MTAEAAADHWRADRYAADARFVADLAADLVTLLNPRPGERILDLGCGDGALTQRIAAGGVVVTGVDASPCMVAAARARGVDAREGRGEALDRAALGAPDGFDAVFSNAALHWMTDADAVARSVARVLRPGGRFVAEMGGHGNVAALRVALIAALRSEAGVDADLADIWCFPTAAEHRARLQAAGFDVIEIGCFNRPTPVAAGGAAWFETLAAPALAKAPAEARAAVLSRATALAATALRDAAGTWTADYVRLRFRAVLGRPGA
jgi:SAM-dependent methyltransferase